MKQLILFFALAAMLTSCGDTLVTEYVTEDYHIQKINLTARAVDWVPNVDEFGRNLYYSCSFDMPEFTPAFYEAGVVHTYYMLNSAQQALPYVRHFETSATQWTKTIDFEYAIGSMTVFVTNSDFVVDPPAGMDFRVVMMW